MDALGDFLGNAQGDIRSAKSPGDPSYLQHAGFVAENRSDGVNRNIPSLCKLQRSEVLISDHERF